MWAVANSLENVQVFLINTGVSLVSVVRKSSA